MWVSAETHVPSGITTLALYGRGENPELTTNIFCLWTDGSPEQRSSSREGEKATLSWQLWVS